MEKYIVIIFIMIMSFGLIGADNEENQINLKPNIRALQFRITDFFRFTSFTGSTISYKKHSTANKAVRYGISLTNSFYNELSDTFKEEFRYDSLYSEYKNSYSTKKLDKYLGFSIEFIRYIKSITDLHPYIGLGTSFYYSGNMFEFENPNPYEYDHGKQYTDSYSIGLVGVIGIEWFFKKSISFHSEYYSNVRAGKEFKKTINFDDPNSYNYGKSITEMEKPFCSIGSYIMFGASFYF